MYAIAKLIVLTAIRDKLFSGVAGLVVLVFSVSLFLGSAAIIEQRETSLVYAAGVVRLTLLLGLSVFMAFHTQKLFESREIELLLTRSLTRSRFVFSYWLGYALVALLLLAPTALVFAGLYGFSAASLIWGLSLLAECFVILAFTLCVILALERAMTAIFATIAFYAFTRLIGFFLGIRDVTPDIGANRIINLMIDVIALVVPRLDLATQSRWLVYGLDSLNGLAFVFGQALVFVIFALCVAAFDLERKQF